MRSTNRIRCISVIFRAILGSASPTLPFPRSRASFPRPLFFASFSIDLRCLFGAITLSRNYGFVEGSKSVDVIGRSTLYR